MIIGTHIPKTGGTCFIDVLRQLFGRRLYHDLSFQGRPVSIWRRLCHGPGGVPWGTRCIFGHFRATKYDRSYPRASHFTWLRDPVERVVSQFHYQVRRAEAAGIAPPVAGKIRRFAMLPAMRDNLSLYLDGKGVDDFVFIGMTEQYDLSVRLFLRVFGFDGQIRVCPANQNPQRTAGAYQIQPVLRQLIIDCNQRDVQLYRAAQERFAELCRAHDLGDDCRLAA